MSDYSTANGKLAKNSVYMTIRLVIVLLVSLYTTRVVLNVLGVEDYGVYNVVAGFVSMFAFVNNSMAGATQRYFNFELGKNGVKGANNVYVIALCIHFILAVLTIAVTEPVGLWYLHNKMVLPEGRMQAAEWIFHLSAVSMFVNIACVPFTAAVMAHERMDFYAIMGMLDSVLKLAMVFILPVIGGDKLVMYGIFFLLVSTFNLSIYIIYCKKRFEECYFRLPISGRLFKSMLSFSGWSLFGSLAYMLREQGVNLVLNAFFGTIVNAARGVASQVNSALTGFVSNITVPARPQVIQSYAKGNIDRTFRLSFSVSKLTTLFFYTMALPISVEVNYILHIWLGDAIPEHTDLFIIIMLFTNTFGCLVSPNSTIMHATGKIKNYQILSSISNLLTVPLAYCFLLFKSIPELVYLALFITMITNILAGLVSVHKYAGLRYIDYYVYVLKPIFIVMLLTIPIAILPFFLMPDNFLRLVVVLFLSVTSIVLVSFFFALDGSEKKLFIQLLSRILNRRHEPNA